MLNTCNDAKIRPFPDETELTCECLVLGHTQHHSTLRDYAFPGSATTIDWLEGDRRNFRGEWPGNCTWVLPGTAARCVLPTGHKGSHAP